VNRTPEVVSRIEELGGYLALDAEGGIRYRVPKGSREAQALLGVVRAESEVILAYLQNRQARQTAPDLPHGIRLVKWILNEPPVAIEACAVVVNPGLFARMTLEQLGIALAHPKRWVGWSVPQLIDRLAQVGVVVMLEEGSRAQ
jgi:hypothetical protein